MSFYKNENGYQIMKERSVWTWVDLCFISRQLADVVCFTILHGTTFTEICRRQ
jgi:hypothetical protein